MTAAPAIPPLEKTSAAAPLLQVRSIAKRFGALEVLKAISLDIAAGEFHHPARRKRLRQNHPVAPDRRIRAAHLRRNLDEWRAPRHAPAIQTPREHGLPAIRALPAPERARQRRLRPARHQHPRRRNRHPRRSTLSAWSRWILSPPLTPQLSAAASSSASLSPARSSIARSFLLLDEPLSALDANLAQANAERAEIPAARSRHHFSLRHSRSGRSHGPLRSHRAAPQTAPSNKSLRHAKFIPAPPPPTPRNSSARPISCALTSTKAWPSAAH